MVARALIALAALAAPAVPAGAADSPPVEVGPPRLAGVEETVRLHYAIEYDSVARDAAGRDGRVLPSVPPAADARFALVRLVGIFRFVVAEPTDGGGWTVRVDTDADGETDDETARTVTAGRGVVRDEVAGLPFELHFDVRDGGSLGDILRVRRTVTRTVRWADLEFDIVAAAGADFTRPTLRSSATGSGDAPRVDEGRWLRLGSHVFEVTADPSGAHIVAVPAPNAPASLHVGAPAPEFEVATVDGWTVASRELQGRWVLVYFWGTWCAPCVEQGPALAAFARERALTVVAVNAGDDPATAGRWVEELGAPWIVVPDGAGRAIRERYRVREFPTGYLVAPDGTIALRSTDPVAIAATMDREKRGGVR